MFRRICVVTFVFLFAAIAFAQTSGKLTTPGNEADPFRLEKGVRFEASVSNGIAGAKKSRLTISAIQSDFAEALEAVRKHHVDGNKLKTEDATKSALEGALHALDPHSSYYDRDEYAALREDQNSEYSGIGTTISNFFTGDETGVFITSTFPFSPASRAGLRFGDRVLKIDGKDASGLTAKEVSNLIRGKKGALVRLTLERAATLQIETVSMRRDSVAQPSIPDAYILDKRIGYIDLSGGFNFTTSKELEVALDDLLENGATSLILDLRDNPGGIVEQAVRVAEEFLSDGKTILSQRGRNGFGQTYWQSNNQEPLDLPLVVLVNENTASASEIVAGALQDHRRALIVGETTFGKGLVQTIIPLASGSGLVLTTSKYYTPAGRSLQRDYSGGSFYDYYARHRNAEAMQIEASAANKQNLGGITPDEIVKQPDLSRAQINLLNPLFVFTRELVNGRIAGFEKYKRQTVQYGHRIQPGELPVDDKLIFAFEQFLETKNFSFNAGQIQKEREFIKTRLRHNLATVAYGSIAANQILIEKDTQIERAVRALLLPNNKTVSGK